MNDNVSDPQAAPQHARRTCPSESLSEQQDSSAETVCGFQAAAIHGDLEADQQHYQNVFLHVPHACLVTDLRGMIQEMNRRAVSLFELQPEAMAGQPLSDYIARDDRPAFFRQLACLQQGRIKECLEYEMHLRSRVGQLFSAALAASVIEDSQGVPTALCWCVYETTCSVCAKAALFQAERLALTAKRGALLLDQLHSPLQGAVGCLSLARETITAQAEVSSYLRMASSELDELSAVINRLHELYQWLVFREQSSTDLRALAERVLAGLAKELAEHRIETSIQSVHYLPMVSVVSQQIEQVLLNLVLNAMQAMPAGGRLEVRLNYQFEPEGVILSIADTGTGMAPEVVSRMFAPPYISRSDALSLGLYVTRSIVEAHGGHIEVESSLGTGTTFRVWLPS